MTDCLRQFILCLNQLQVMNSKGRPNLKVKRYLRKLDREWQNGSNERRQSEEAFLKIIAHPGLPGYVKDENKVFTGTTN